MSSLLQDARNGCPELVDIIKEMETFAYSHGYGKVFNDFVDWLVFQHQYPPSDNDPLKSSYKESEYKHFLSMYQTLQNEVRNRVSLWDNNSNTQKTFYDPLGKLYEVIKTNHKSSLLGQYFTPTNIVEMMTLMMNIGEGRGRMTTILDPASGSGRLGLSAATHAMNKNIPTWVTMGDIDPLCTKMTAVNMALNGVVGEAVNMNGLDITGDTYRFGYKVIPLYTQIPQRQRELYRLAIMSKTGQDIKKQYGLIPLEYKETYFSQVNNSVLKRLEKVRQLESEEQRKEAEKAIQDEIKARFKNSLFENDEILTQDVKLPSETTPKKKTSKKSKSNNSNSSGEQGSLF